MISGEALKQSRNGWLRGQDGSPSCQLNTTGMDWKDKSGTRKVLIQLQRYCRSSSKKQRLFGLCTYINHHPPPRILTFTTSLKGQHQILPCVFFVCKGGNLPSLFYGHCPKNFWSRDLRCCELRGYPPFWTFFVGEKELESWRTEHTQPRFLRKHPKSSFLKDVIPKTKWILMYIKYLRWPWTGLNMAVNSRTSLRLSILNQL